jgi:hypothetical protein
MGFNSQDRNIKAQSTYTLTVPSGRADSITSSILDGKFVEMDCTPQVNWILQNTAAAGNANNYSGLYAVVFLVTIGNGSTGKILTYTCESPGCPIAKGSDHPWTKDNNSGHLVIEGYSVSSIGDKGHDKVASSSYLNTAPNPLVNETTIEYEIAGTGFIKIYNLLGKCIYSKAILGNGNIIWNPANNESGLYICRMTSSREKMARNIFVIR